MNEFTLNYIQSEINNGGALLYVNNWTIPDNLIIKKYWINDIVSFAPMESRFFAEIYDIIQRNNPDKDYTNYVFVLVDNSTYINLLLNENINKIQYIYNEVFKKFIDLFKKDFWLINWEILNWNNLYYRFEKDIHAPFLQELSEELRSNLVINSDDIIDLSNILIEYDKTHRGVDKLKMDIFIDIINNRLLLDFVQNEINSLNNRSLFINDVDYYSVLAFIVFFILKNIIIFNKPNRNEEFFIVILAQIFKELTESYLITERLYNISEKLANYMDNLILEEFFIDELVRETNNKRISRYEYVFSNYEKYFNIINMETKLLKRFLTLKD